MFGLTLKERAEEALKRGTKAVLVGGFFHVNDAERFGLNEDATSYLYTEAQAHQIYALTVIFHQTLAKEKSWATPAFAIKAITGAATEFEIEHGISPGSISFSVFRRCTEIDNLSPQERLDGKHFAQSADRVLDRDPSADRAAVARALEGATHRYFDQALRMFKT